MMTPTERTYRELQDAYSYFNRLLFGARLPDCLITMQRKPRTLGYFCGDRFVDRLGGTTDEIALNPRYFVSRTERGVLSTLAHEMVHLWQHHFGHAGRLGYHNRQWADELISVGLYPSDTGEPGGRETGYHMSHYIVDQGPFDRLCADLLASGFAFSWVQDARDGSPPPTTVSIKGLADNSNRWKYTCPNCLANAWAKPAAALICGRCNLSMPRNQSRQS